MAKAKPIPPPELELPRYHARKLRPGPRGYVVIDRSTGTEMCPPMSLAAAWELARSLGHRPSPTLQPTS